MSPTQVIGPKVTAVIMGKPVPITRVVMTLVAGGVSTCAVSGQAEDAQPEKPRVVDMLAADIAQKVGGYQDRLFELRSSWDSIVTIEDGLGGTVEFQGYFSSPSYSNLPGSTGLNYVIVHESIILSAFRSSIYGTSVTVREFLSKGGPVSQIQDINIAARFKKILKKVIALWEQNLPRKLPGDQLVALAAQHQQNQKILPFLEGVLDASTIQYDSLKGVVDYASKESYDLSDFILNQLVLPHGSSFLDNIHAFEQNFQALLVPLVGDADGNVAQLIPQKEAMGDAFPLSLPITEFNYSGGDKHMLPVTSVVISNSSGVTFRAGAVAPAINIPEQRLYAYPETPITGGDVMYDTGPAWLSRVGIKPDPTAAREAARETTGGLDINKWPIQRRAFVDHMGKTSDVKHMAVIKEWAKNLYNYAALEGSAATLNVPLCVPMKPGVRYAVSNMAGVPLFTGFLQQVSHSVSLQSRPPQAGTLLYFSHIEAGAFKLPHS